MASVHGVLGAARAKVDRRGGASTAGVSVAVLVPLLQSEWLDAVFGSLVCTVIFIVPLLIKVFICYWVYKDARSRGMSAVWVLAPLFLGLLGLIIYILVRGDRSPSYPMYPAYYPPPGYAPPPPQAYPGYTPPYGGQQAPGQYIVEEYYVDEQGRRVPPPGY
jgi:hypothetical protein